MLERPLRYAAVVLSLIVVAGFGLWAIREAVDATENARGRVTDTAVADPSDAGERAREARNSTVHEWIDDANDVVLKPFSGIVASHDRWVQRGLPSLFALLVYGFLLAFLARFGRGWGMTPVAKRLATDRR